jgi:hypothetical protein
MGACLNEIRKSKKVDSSELTLENGLFKSFDQIVSRQLDPIWHTVRATPAVLLRPTASRGGRDAGSLQRLKAPTCRAFMCGVRIGRFGFGTLATDNRP